MRAAILNGAPRPPSPVEQLMQLGAEYNKLAGEVQAAQAAGSPPELGAILNLLMLRISMIDVKIDGVMMRLGAKDASAPRIVVP